MLKLTSRKLTRNVENDAKQSAKLVKLFTRDNLHKSAIEMAYLIESNFDETVKLTI